MKRPGQAAQMRQQEEGYQRSLVLNKIGMPVTVRKDDGAEVQTTIGQLPWQLGHGQWVIGVVGFSGGYDITRVTAKVS